VGIFVGEWLIVGEGLVVGWWVVLEVVGETDGGEVSSVELLDVGARVMLLVEGV